MRLRPAGIAAALVTALVLGTYVPAVADDKLNNKKKSIDAQIKATAGDLDELTAEVAQAAVALDAAKTQLPAAEAEVANASAQLGQAQQAEAELRFRLQAAQRQQQDAEQAVADVIKRIAETKRITGRIARDVYQQGPFSEVALVLQSDSPDELAERMAGIQSIFRSRGHAMARMAEDQAELSRQQDKLRGAKEKVAAEQQAAVEHVAQMKVLADRAAAAKAQVDRLVASRNQALQTAASAKAAEMQRLAELQAEQKRVAAQIAAASRAPAGTIPSGELLWPANGRKTGDVGPRIHPVYGYRSCHTGMDIGAAMGSPIFAAASGTVLSTSVSVAYGNMTIIDHGNGLSTMYAHQSRFGVSPGQHVNRGQTIGYVGSTGFSTGAHLHFEVHINGTPYDPMGWFGGRKVPVSC